MSEFNKKHTNRVFEIFEELSKIPRGSGNMEKIADFCVDFAKKNNLKFIRDDADNVIIFKNASENCKNTKPIILQGHLDMVCQKTAESKHDFSVSGPELVIDGDFLTAVDTTLGADNGIAVAMIMTVLESKDLTHPAIEAVFTTDEEIGMIGATALDTSCLKGQTMINLDSEEDDTITVSCAGGSEFLIKVPTTRILLKGKTVNISITGLQGGHSGIDINKGRVNANILAGRLLNHLYQSNKFNIVSINGGDKSNAITPSCEIVLCCEDFDELLNEIKTYTDVLKIELFSREPDLDVIYSTIDINECEAFSNKLTEKIIFFLNSSPYGVVEMSAEINGLVETSLNLGILNTNDKEILIDYSLRSNKVSSLKYLEEKLITYAKIFDGVYDISGFYPPWEFNTNSEIQKFFTKCFKEFYGKMPKIEAIHAGLECGVFSSKIKNLDCIAVGPSSFDVHTVNERLSISSTKKFFELLLIVLSEISK